MASLRQDVDVGLITFIGVVGAMVLLILVLGVQAWFGYESDRILQQRYATDQNIELRALKAEQYANLGDTVGNATIYADPIDFPTRFIMPGEGLSTDRRDFTRSPDGFRFADDDRTRLVVPIHAAMAAVVRERSGRDVTAEAMRQADRGYVTLVKDAYRDPQAYVRPPSARQDDAAGATNTSNGGVSAD